MQRISRILVVLIAVNLPLSCNDDLDCGFIPQEARIKALSSTIGSYSHDFTETHSTHYDLAAIQIRISEMEYSEVASNSYHSISFLNTAYACSPPPPEPTQGIEAIIVTAQEPVFSHGKRFEPGTDLIELFKVASHLGSTQNITVPEFLRRQREDLWIFGHHGAKITFKLNISPDSSINQSLRFTFEFSDSESIEFETEDFVVD